MKSGDYNIPTTLVPEIFRAYDVRGVVGENFNEHTFYALGLALGHNSQQQGQSTIIVGRDGRLTSPGLAAALISGLLASGCEVVDIGAVPTPLVYFATHHLAISSGVMITGSHNPGHYNGLKMVIAGLTLSEAAILRLRQQILAGVTPAVKCGHLREVAIIPAYIAAVTRDIKLAQRLKVVIDCGNGIAGVLAEQLYTALGCEVIPLYCEVDGHFPNHHPDPSVAENLATLIATVKAERADIGLAFDGDADRLGVVTAKGEIIVADRQMLVFAAQVLAAHPGAEIIYDVKCTNHLAAVVTQLGGKATLCKTGHSFIKSKLKETGAKFAGEMSGHLFFNDKWYGFDDGLYAGARLLEIIAASTTDVFANLPNSINTPELKISVSEADKFTLMTAFINHAQFPLAEVITLDGVRANFSNGWGLVRASNTSPYLIARFEADDVVALQSIQQQFKQQLLTLAPNLELPF